MSKVYKVSDEIKKNAHLKLDEYQKMYKESVESPETFWAREAERITWSEKWKTVKDTSYEGDVHIRWFDGGKLNATYNCLDRHLLRNQCNR